MLFTDSVGLMEAGLRHLQERDRAGEFVGKKLRLSSDAKVAAMFHSVEELGMIYPYLQMELSNQVFLMLYGNFEAYLAEMLLAGFHVCNQERPTPKSPKRRTLNVLLNNWPGIFKKIRKDLDIELTRDDLRDWHRTLPADFQVSINGERKQCPIDLLGSLAESRHLMTHFASRLDQDTAAKHGVEAGKRIQMPVVFVQGIAQYLERLSEPIDAAFAERFGWPQETVDPNSLCFPPRGWPKPVQDAGKL